MGEDGQLTVESVARAVAAVRGYNFDRLPERSWFFGLNESKARMLKRGAEVLKLIRNKEEELLTRLDG